MEQINSLTAETILSEEIFEEIFSQEDEIYKARLLLTLVDRAKALGVKQKFDTMVKAYDKVAKNIEKDRRAEENQKKKQRAESFNNYTQFDYFEDGKEYYCGNWVANDTGVSTFNMFGEKLACYHPILPVQRMVNAETGKEKVKIAFKKGSKWKEIVVDKGVIASANKIVQLADYGVSVTSETAKTLVSFLADLENMNINDIACRVSTSKLGWINGEFMPYSDSIEFDSEMRFKDIFESISQKGSRDIWFGLMKKIRNSNRIEPRIYIAGSFASVLLKPLSILPFIVNLWGDTGKGKTVALMVAASIWANPGESKYITDPSDTLISMEVRNDILNNLPMMIDDLSKTRDKYGDMFTDIIYMLCGGKGKNRSNKDLGLNKATTWQNVVLTNIERPLTSETMRGGAINRILDFEMAEGYIFENGNKVVELIKNNYGFAGREFIELIKSIGFDEVRTMQEDFLEQIKAKVKELEVEKEEKQIIPLSVLLVADKLAADHIFKDGIYLDLEMCVNSLKDKNEVSENDRAYEFILSEVQVNINKFKPDSNGEYKGEMWGKIENGYAVILNSAFNRICERGNFSSRAFLSWASKNDLIIQQGGKNTRVTKFGNTSSRCIWLKIDSTTTTDKDGFMIIDPEQMELPFDV